MTSPVARFVRTWLSVLVGLLSAPLAWPVHAGPDDSYLKEINAEGHQLEFLGKARVEHEQLQRLEAAEKSHGSTPPAAPPKTAYPAAAAAAVSQSAFESALRQRFPGNYALYDVMNPDEKHQVYVEYQKNSVEGTARFLPAVRKIIAITTANSANRARVRSNTN